MFRFHTRVFRLPSLLSSPLFSSPVQLLQLIPYCILYLVTCNLYLVDGRWFLIDGRRSEIDDDEIIALSFR